MPGREAGKAKPLKVGASGLAQRCRRTARCCCCAAAPLQRCSCMHGPLCKQVCFGLQSPNACAFRDQWSPHTHGGLRMRLAHEARPRRCCCVLRAVRRPPQAPKKGPKEYDEEDLALLKKKKVRAAAGRRLPSAVHAESLALVQRARARQAFGAPRALVGRCSCGQRTIPAARGPSCSALTWPRGVLITRNALSSPQEEEKALKEAREKLKGKK